MKNLVVALSLTVLLGGLNPSYADFAGGEGAGVRGGGHVVEIGGKLELLDLLEGSTFDCSSGQEMIDSNLKLDQVLNKIARLDWYLAGELRREIRFLRWCMTGELYQVPAYDDDTFVKGLKKGLQQAGFRYNDVSYLDQAKYRRLSARSQALLVIHEAFHSYLSMRDPLRMDHLRSMVNTFSRIESGDITTRAKLHLQMEVNQVLFPRTVGKLDRYRKQVEFLVASSDEKREIILRTQAPETLIQLPWEQVSPLLAPWDQKKGPLDDILVQALADILIEGSAADLQKILNEKSWTEINPAEIAMSVLEELSTEKRGILFQSEELPKLFKANLVYLTEAELTQSNFRILANPSLQSIAALPAYSAPIPLTSLQPRDGEEEQPLPLAIRSLENSIVHLIRNGEWEQVKVLFTQNPEFYRALGLKSQFEKLETWVTPIERERPLASKVLVELRDGLLKRFWQDMQGMLTQKEYEAFLGLIEFENFN